MPPRSRWTREQRLLHAIEAIDEITTFVDGLKVEDYLTSSLHRSAVGLQLIQIAEALKPLDEADDSLRHDIPQLGRIIGTRNLIAHEYKRVDDQIIWTIVTTDMPILRAQLLGLLEGT